MTARERAAELGIEVRIGPRWMPMAAITLVPFGAIYVHPDCIEDERLLEHELVHVAQQRAHPVWFFVSYVLLLPAFWCPWRVRWEAEAYRVDVATGRLTLEGAARALSSALYLWPCSYLRALRAIGGEGA